ncbi:MAG TPA: hemerythrin domain-containing protein, partial [Pseudonocardiaceae bacterium]|nr:hemerythrin domain-containing protein [Pseudonocardiaceae bacterium]
RDRADYVGQHLFGMVTGLHHHHAAEDELLWPILLDRVRPHAALVHRMEAQHKRLSVHIDRINELLPGWRLTADSVTGRELAAEFAAASAALNEHLDEEENEILPLVSEHITPAEWQALGDRGMEGLPKNNTAFIFLGLLLRDANEQERRAFLRLPPAPIRWAWFLFGQRIYRRAYARLYDPVTSQR